MNIETLGSGILAILFIFLIIKIIDRKTWDKDLKEKRFK
jgi:hypothetical protein